MREILVVDTNILLDMAMQDRPGHFSALMLLDEIEMREIDAWICATSLKDVYYVLSKYMNEQDARLYVKAITDVFNLYTIDSAVCTQALSSMEPDFEDGLVRACAENLRASFIISRDEKAYKNSFVKSLSAEEYIKTKGNWGAVPLA